MRAHTLFGDFGRSVRAIGVALALMAPLAACATAATQQPPATAAAQAAVDNPAAYLLGPGDTLRVTVFGQPDLTGNYVVATTGMIAYPLIGDLRAEGLTVAQFGLDLAQALQQGFVRDPNVSVEIATYRPFFILGEVNEPGTFPYSSGLTVMRAVATAGGFTYRANTGRVYIQHPGDTQERAYELDSLTRVLPGDTVRVPERLF